MRALLMAFAALALAAGFSCEANRSGQLPNARSLGGPEVAVRLQDPQINESSGLARSHREKGWLYTHNDSGDTARFWRFDLLGKLNGPYTLKGVSAVDWEDMASASLGGRHYLYFADIGDNAGKRASIQIYRVEEPKGDKGEISQVDVFELKYPDRAHNAEAFMVDPSSGSFWIVTKIASKPSKVFLLERPSKPGAYTLKEAGEVLFESSLDAGRLVTGGDISPDGKHLAVRTYLNIHEFAMGPEWWKGKPLTAAAPAEIQGEAVAYALDGSCLLTSSEYSPCPISRIPILPSRQP